MMLPLTVFGDYNATLSTYDLKADKQAIPGVPINDIALKRIMEFCLQRYELLLWCNSYPLMGAEVLIKDDAHFRKTPGERWINYSKFPEKRGFFSQTFWKGLTDTQLASITQNYFDMNEFVHQEFGEKMIILPLSAYIFDRVLELNLGIYPRLLDYAWRMVDISVLDTLTNEQAFTEKNTLTEPAYRLIEPKIKEMIV